MFSKWRSFNYGRYQGIYFTLREGGGMETHMARSGIFVLNEIPIGDQSGRGSSFKP